MNQYQILKKYYDVLELSENATIDDIKKAYKKLMQKYHPDRVVNESDAVKKEYEAKFKVINEAKEKLLNPEKAISEEMQHGGGGHGFSPFSDLGDIFESFFGGRQHGSKKETIDLDVHIETTISFKESFSGLEKEIHYFKNTTCKDCNGTGHKDKNYKPKKCSHCNGQGKVGINQGMWNVIQTCSHCEGTGYEKVKHNDKCKTCNGNKVVRNKTPLKLSIPAGSFNGYNFVIKNNGSELNGKKGNLIVQVKVDSEQYKEYKRNKLDLIVEINIDFIDMIIGNKIEFENEITGNIDIITIPKFSKHKDSVIFSFKGFKNPEKPVMAGRLIYVINSKFPTTLNENQIKYLEEFKSIK